MPERNRTRTGLGAQTPMLSRVAESIYWLNRYVERAENVARFIDVNLNLSLDTGGEATAQWEPIVITTGDRAVFKERFGEATRESAIRFLTSDLQNPNSICSCLAAARENARTVREILSSEVWEQLNDFYLTVQESAQRGNALSDPYEFYAYVKRSSHLFVGLSDTSMSHDEGWHFGRIGRYLERADQTSRILDVKYFYLLPDVADVGSPFDNIQWAAVLKSASALEMYRKVWRRVYPVRVGQFLLLDPDFPRSVRFCLNLAERSLRAVTEVPDARARSALERLSLLHDRLAQADMETIIAEGSHQYLDRLQLELIEVGRAVAVDFFGVHAESPHAGTEQ